MIGCTSPAPLPETGEQIKKRHDLLTQQIILREACKFLGLTQVDMAKRMRVPWRTFEKWMCSPGSSSAHKMPSVATQLVFEIIEHEKLKIEFAKISASAKIKKVRHRSS